MRAGATGPGRWRSWTPSGTWASTPRWPWMPRATESHQPTTHVSNLYLKYATKSGGVWTLETVDASGAVGLYTSLALDAPRQAQHQLHQRTARTSTSDTRAEAAVPGRLQRPWTPLGMGSFLRWVIDPHGDPVISYFDATNADLKLAFLSASGWTIETGVDSPGDAGGLESRALADNLGDPTSS